MPTFVSILDHLNLVMIRSHGRLTDCDARAAFETYATHPLARPGQNMLHDMTDVTAAQVTYSERMALQSAMEPILTMGQKLRTYVMLAPNPTARRVAETYLPFWDAVPAMDVRIAGDYDAALVLLHLSPTDVDSAIFAPQ